MARIARLVTGLFALGALLVAAPRASAQTPPSLTLLRIAAVPSDTIATLTYAERSGMFRKAGLDVQFTKATSGAAVVAAVVSGSYDIGHSSLIPFVNAYLHRIPLTMVAAAAVYDARSPYAQMIVAADAPFKTGADLNGKTIAVSSLNDITGMAAAAWVDANGGDSRTLRFVEIPISAVPATIEEHRVDAGIVFYPPLGAALAAGKVRLFAPAFNAIGPFFVASAWIATTDWASKHPDAARAFNDVFQRAAAYTNTHHAETVGLSSEMTGTPPEVVAKMVRIDVATAMDPAVIQPMIDAAVKYKAIPKSLAAKDLIFAPLLTK